MLFLIHSSERPGPSYSFSTSVWDSCFFFFGRGAEGAENVREISGDFWASEGDRTGELGWTGELGPPDSSCWLVPGGRGSTFSTPWLGSEFKFKIDLFVWTFTNSLFLNFSEFQIFLCSACYKNFPWKISYKDQFHRTKSNLLRMIEVFPVPKTLAGCKFSNLYPWQSFWRYNVYWVLLIIMWPVWTRLIVASKRVTII